MNLFANSSSFPLAMIVEGVVTCDWLNPAYAAHADTAGEPRTGKRTPKPQQGQPS
jgi:hypothetical protein